MSRNWKAQIQVLDLSDSDRLEVECKTCGMFRYEECIELKADARTKQLYLDELEAQLKCHRWGCGKPVRIALPSNVETEGFQGGLA